QTPPGSPLLRPTPQSKPPAHDADDLVLHLTARVIKLGGAWDQFPAENWIVLPRTTWTKLLPPGPAGASSKSWDIDKDAAAALLRYFYPATETNHVSQNRIENLVLKGRVISVRDGVIRVRLSGQLRMKHTFYQKEDANAVAANLAGFFDFDSRKNAVRSFQVVTDEATYGHGTFGIAVRS